MSYRTQTCVPLCASTRRRAAGTIDADGRRVIGALGLVGWLVGWLIVAVVRERAGGVMAP